MLDFGYPTHIRTDGGPQFRGPFKDWCNLKNIIHEVSSPYHAQSNGHAEQAVKMAKLILKKTGANLRQFREHLFAWRNTPRADGFSPADLFFGCRQRGELPTVRRPECSPEEAATSRKEEAVKIKKRHGEKTLALTPLQSGTNVTVRDPSTGDWVGEGVVVRPCRSDALSYYVNIDGASTPSIRNRTWLKPKSDKSVTFQTSK